MATSRALSSLLRAAHKASRAARAAAAAASRAAAMASRSAREADRLRSGIRAALETWQAACTKPLDNTPCFDYIAYFNSPEYKRVPDDAKTPTDKDFESDEAVWALYERWCKGFNKQRDHAEMVRRFKLFKHKADYVHHCNTDLPPDPEEAAVYVQKREEVKLLLSKGEDVSQFDDWYLPMELGPFSDGGDPLSEFHLGLLKRIEERELNTAVVEEATTTAE